MLGTLPTTLDVNGHTYGIRTDYRDILRIISAFNDAELSDREKVYVCMNLVYKDLDNIPKDDFEAAYKAAFSFIECNIQDDRPSPKVVNWEKDEQLIFPAVNKVAGCEVRSVPYMHWWTFLGYFQGIDREDTWGFILTLRQKKARHKKMEKYEKEFWAANRALCSVEDAKTYKQSANDTMAKMYEELLKKEGENNGE